MKVSNLVFLFLLLVGCSSTPLTLTPTQYSYRNKERTRQVDSANLPLPPTIVLRDIQRSFWQRKAVLDVQGWYSSSGLRARKLSRISISHEIEGNQMTLTCYVIPKGGFGKEGNQIYGYNYRLTTSLKIPSDVEQLHVKLMEQDTSQHEILRFESIISLTNAE